MHLDKQTKIKICNIMIPCLLVLGIGTIMYPQIKPIYPETKNNNSNYRTIQKEPEKTSENKIETQEQTAEKKKTPDTSKTTKKEKITNEQSQQKTETTVDTSQKETKPESKTEPEPQTIEQTSNTINFGVPETHLWSDHAHDDGSIVEWAPGYYIAHDWSEWGNLIHALNIGDRINISNIDATVSGIYEVSKYLPYENIRDEITGWDTICFQTCIPYSDYNTVVTARPNIAQDYSYEATGIEPKNDIITTWEEVETEYQTDTGQNSISGSIQANPETNSSAIMSGQIG